MKRLLYLFVLFLLCSVKAYAAGGACPASSDYPGTTPFTFNATLASIGITQCYYAQAGGNDTAAGTTEGTAWAHIPGMVGCANACAAVTPSAGTGFILRGGDTWTTSTGLPVSWGWSGAAGNPIYIGIDSAWFSGGSWSRPIWSAASGTFNTPSTNKSYYILDDIEMPTLVDVCTNCGMSNESGSSPNFINAYGQNQIIQRIYAHGWSTNRTNSNPGSQFVRFAAGSNSTGATMRYNVIDGTDSTQNMLFVTFTNTPIAYGNEIKLVYTGLDGCGDNWHDNTVDTLVEGVVIGHQDGLYQVSPCYSSTPLIYNNRIQNNTNPLLGGAVKMWLSGNGGCPFSSCTNYTFGNVFWNNYPGNMLDITSHYAQNYGIFNVFGNTISCGTDSAQGACDATNEFDGPETASNTSNTIGTGSKTFTITAFQGNVGLTIGGPIMVWQPVGGAPPNNYMIGTVTSYSNPTLVINVTSVGGSGTISNWIIGAQAVINQTNNHYITTGNGGDTCGGGYTCNRTTDLQQTVSVANGQGYNDSGSFAFQPTNSNGGTVGKGTNVSSLCSAISAFDSFAGTACANQTSYSIIYNQTTHSISYPALTPVVGRPSGNPDIGAYQLQTCTNNCATVTWTNVHQTMDGFGVSDAFQGSAMTNGNADTLFSTTAGAGLSLLRMNLPSNCSDDGGDCSSVNSGCAGQSAGDAAKAVARGARVWATSFTPPASMKSNASCTNGGSLLAGSYGAFANWQKNFVTSFINTTGITPLAISVANEPDITASYDSSTWSGQNMHDYILNNLGPTLGASNATGIIMPEPSESSRLPTYANTCMGAADACPSFVDIVANHAYGGAATAYTTGITNQHLWETEYAILTGGPFDPSIGTAVNTFATNIHSYMVLNRSAWHFWTWHSSNAAQQLIDISTGAISQTLYVEGQWSKFVRPGCVRIDATATPQAGVLVTAFKCPNNTFAIVAVNTNTGSVTQNFGLSAFPAVSPALVTPYLTSGTTNHITAQATIPVGSGFSAPLPGTSVETFVGSTSSTSPAVCWSTSSLAFGTVTIGGNPTQTVTLTNCGTAPLNVSLGISGSSVFTIPSNTCGTTLAASSSCTVTVEFTPTAATSYSANLTETDSTHGVSGIVTLTGTGASASAPAVCWTPTAFNFGNVSISSTPTETFTLKNCGSATLNVSTSVTGSGFSQSATTCASSLSANVSCTVTVQFAPALNQSYSGTLTETDTPNSVMGSASLSGTGVPAALPAITWSPTPFYFGAQFTGSTTLAVFSLTNSGSAPLNIATTVSGTGFTISGTTCVSPLDVNATCTVTVQFVPLATAAYSGVLTETDTTNNISGSVPLSGNGIPGVSKASKLLL